MDAHRRLSRTPLVEEMSHVEEYTTERKLKRILTEMLFASSYIDPLVHVIYAKIGLAPILAARCEQPFFSTVRELREMKDEV